MRSLGPSSSLLLFLLLLFHPAQAQEFPIALGPETVLGGGGAFDGTNMMFALMGDASNEYALSVQFVAMNGTLVGSRIPLGQTGSGPMVAFDGTNYLVAWTDSFPTFASGDSNGIGNVYGQFISTSGTLVGSRLTLLTGVNIKWGKGRGNIAFNGTTYVLSCLIGADHHTQYLYARRFSTSGTPQGGAVQISIGYAREHAFAFDGANYLFTWCTSNHPEADRYLYGQFMSVGGALIGSNFLIDGDEQPSDNPISIVWSGTKYWVAYFEEAADTTGDWNIYYRFVSPAGVVSARGFVADSTLSPFYASAAFDGTNYLMSWIEFAGAPRVRGQFMAADGTRIDTAFTLFEPIGDKIPMGGVGGFVNGMFVLSANRMSETDVDVYGMFLPASTTAVEDGASAPQDFVLMPNYPNPFNPATVITYTVAAPSEPRASTERSRSASRGGVEGQHGSIRLAVFDLLGREVAVLVNKQLPPGTYSTTWNAGDVPSGMYFYRLEARGGDGERWLQTRKMVLMR